MHQYIIKVYTRPYMCYKKLLNIVLYYEKKNIEEKKKIYVEFLQVIVKRAFRYQLFKSGCLMLFCPIAI